MPLSIAFLYFVLGVTLGWFFITLLLTGISLIFSLVWPNNVEVFVQSWMRRLRRWELIDYFYVYPMLGLLFVWGEIHYVRLAIHHHRWNVDQEFSRWARV